MEVIKLVKLGVLVLGVLYFIYKFFLGKKESDQFYSIEDNRNNKLLIDPKIPLNDFEKISENFEGKPFDKYDNPVYEYSELLLDPLFDLSEESSEEAYFEKLNRSQRLFSVLMQLEGQINNGGTYQFLWNRPESMYAAKEALDELGMQPLANDFAAVIEELDKKADSYIEDRMIWADNSKSEEEKWAAFQKGRAYIPAGKKIEDYFYEDEFVEKFHNAIIEYIKNNKGAFGVS